MMAENSNTGFALEHSELIGPDRARHRNQLTASRAVKVVMMGIDQFEPGAPIVEDQLANDVPTGKLLGGAKDRGKIRRNMSLGESAVEIFKRPRVVIAPAHNVEDRKGDDGFARHTQKITAVDP
jgi:hypothetical protein